MSMIFGVFYLDGRPVEGHELQRMGISMMCPGSNGTSIWTEGTVGLGCNMLCTTPESFYQELPFRDAEAGMVITADARIDNREELSQALHIPLLDSKIVPDEILILRAFQKWGKDCPDHLLGDFAFAIWDQNRQNLFCARDHMGSHPFYYYKGPECFAFASGIHGLLGLDNVTRRLNEQKILDYLLLIPSEGNITFYTDIMQLAPAHVMTVTEETFSIHRHWFLESLPEIRYGDEEQYLEKFREIFLSSVRSSLRTQYPIGIFLSGGFDSTSVAAIAGSELEKSGKSLYSFTAVPIKEIYQEELPKNIIIDESSSVKELCGQFKNIRPFFLDSDGMAPFNYLNRLYAQYGQPIWAVGNLHWAFNIMDKAKQMGIRVMLTGAMGNATLSFNGRGYFPSLLRKGRWLTLLKEFCAIWRQDSINPFSFMALQVLSPFIPSFIWERIYGIKREKGLYHEPWGLYTPVKKEFLNRMDYRQRLKDRAHDMNFRIPSDTHKTRFKMIRPYDHDYIDVNTSLASHAGLEKRDPTACRRLVEFCLAIPDEQFIHNGHTRRLVKNGMKGILPGYLLQSRVKGLQGADNILRLKIFRDELNHMVRKIEASPAASTYLEMPELKKAINALITPKEKGIKRNSFNLFRFVSRGMALGYFIHWSENEKDNRFQWGKQ